MRLVAITLVGLGLRLAFIGAAPLWYDEAGSFWMATLPFERMIAATAADTHPPLYLALLWGWVRLAGESEAAVRLPSALLSTLIIPAAYAIARELHMDRRAALWGAALVAVLPAQLHYAQEARMYALLSVLFALALLAALRGSAPLLALALALMYWTHNYGLLLAVPVNVVYLVQLRRCNATSLPRDLIWLAWWNTIALLAWAPWMFVLLNQMREVSQGYWLQPATPGAVLYALYMITFSFAQSEPMQTALALMLFAALAFTAWRARLHSGARLALLAAGLCFAVPVALSWVWRPVLLFRGLMPASALLCVLVAWACTHGLSTRRRALLALGGLPLVLVAAALYYVRSPALKDDTAALDRIALRPGDIVYHINDGSMMIGHWYAPEWPQFEMPAAWRNIGALTPATRQALGVQVYFLEEIKWRRAWLVHGATPMTTAQEDAAVQAILNTYPHQLIYLNESPAARQVIYLIWNKGVAVQ